MTNPIIRGAGRFRPASAVSILAILAASCSSYAGDRRTDYQDHAPAPVYFDNRGTERPDYEASGTGVRGIDSARDAHRRYSGYRAEQLDGDCERRVAIRYGETLSDLAELCDVSVESILDANPGVRNPRNIAVGQQFYIPVQHAAVYGDRSDESRRTDAAYRGADGRSDYYDDATGRDYHVVRRGDTLGDIAARYNVTLSDVIDLNRNVRSRNLEIGDRIYLPADARAEQSHRRTDRDVSVDRRRPAVSFSPVRGPRDGEIRLIGSNFGSGEKVVVLYGDQRDSLVQIRTIEADQYGQINESVRLPDAYQSDEAYFAMRRGSDTYVSDNTYSVDYADSDRRANSQVDYGRVPGLLQRPAEQSSSAVLSATDSEVYRSDTVSLSAFGFPPNTPVSIYGGPSRDTLTKISEIRTGPTGLFQTEVRVPDNVDGETVLFVAAVEDGARTYFTERVRVRSDEGDSNDRGRDGAGVSVIYPDQGGRSYGVAANGSTTLDRGVERQAYGGPSFFSRFQKRNAADVTNINAGGQGAISGVLTNEGKKCPTLRDDAGNIFSLLGDLGRFGDGDRVLIRGSTAVDDRICDQSETIQIFAIESAPW